MPSSIKTKSRITSFQPGIPPIRHVSGKARVETTGQPVEDTAATDENPHVRYAPPSRARLNIIPGNTQLYALVTLAKKAIKHGIFWQRGTILNILS